MVKAKNNLGHKNSHKSCYWAHLLIGLEQFYIHLLLIECNARDLSMPDDWLFIYPFIYLCTWKLTCMLFKCIFIQGHCSILLQSGSVTFIFSPFHIVLNFCHIIYLFILNIVLSLSHKLAKNICILERWICFVWLKSLNNYYIFLFAKM